jgi:putative membrane-bound dehydrogenase-like protein
LNHISPAGLRPQSRRFPAGQIHLKLGRAAPGQYSAKGYADSTDTPAHCQFLLDRLKPLQCGDQTCRSERKRFVKKACWWQAAILIVLAGSSRLAAETPRPLDDRLILELVAREPDIVTPTGLAVDETGRVWVIENNTHHRPADYRGPSSDRVRIFSDFDEQGRARHIATFAEGFDRSMSLALGKGGAVYLATRSQIYLLRDRAGRGTADERRVIVHLDTRASYPHNGLSGFAFDALGNLYFGLGENEGLPYRLIGSDGSTLEGGGEGGSIYRCRPDGSHVVRIATGFWNPFHIGFDAFGRLFAVDNDPDSRGPCRLLHIVEGGDYGYRYRNGRKGLHPFTAWNGELPSTLPMVAGTSEAPCAVVAYESNGLPTDYCGDLLVTSWGDHVIERFRLQRKGASFTSQARIIVKGGEDFRPVAMATAPDGSLYFSDWVDKSYPVHGKGRIWRLRGKNPAATVPLRPSEVVKLPPGRQQQLLADPRRDIRLAAGEALGHAGRKAELAAVLKGGKDLRARIHALWGIARLPSPSGGELITETLKDPAAELRAAAAHLLAGDPVPGSELRLRELAIWDLDPLVRLNAILGLRTDSSFEEMVPVLADPDPFLAAAALYLLGQPEHTQLLTAARLQHAEPRVRLGILLAVRRGGDAVGRSLLPQFLADPDPDIRRTAIQWVGEERLSEFAPQLDRSAAQPPVTQQVFEALLATREFLAGVHRQPSDEFGGQDYIARIVNDAGQPAALRAVALRMLRADYSGLNTSRLGEFIHGQDRDLRREAAHKLSMRADRSSQSLLLQLAGDDKLDEALRADAILGLAYSARTAPPARQMLFSLIEHPDFWRDALRSLREVPLTLQEQNQFISHCRRQIERAKAWPQTDKQELCDQITMVLHHLTSKAPGILPLKSELSVLVSKGMATPGKPLPGAGERVFFHPRGPRCFVCHRVDGCGAAIGPDLSLIGRSLSRDKLVESILQPSKEIAPQFVTWVLTLRNGQIRTGMIVGEGWDSTITLADAQGKLEVLQRLDVEDRRALSTSIMPEHLRGLMTEREFRDLIAYLESRK